MLKKIFLYGTLLAVIILVVQYFKMQYFAGHLALEYYSSALTAVAILLGVWLGINYKKKKSSEALAETAENIDHHKLKLLSRRELEVLELMANGFSNQEIADQLFVSIHTVKTHTTNIYEKLQVKRRTQAIVKARELQII